MPRVAWFVNFRYSPIRLCFGTFGNWGTDGWQLICTHIYIAWKFHFQIFSLSQLTVLLKLVMRKLQDKYMAFFILSQILTVRTLPVPRSKAGTEAAEKITDRCLLEEDNISDVTSPWTSEVLFEKHLEL